MGENNVVYPLAIHDPEMELSSHELQIAASMILDSAIAERSRHSNYDTFHFYADIIGKLAWIAFNQMLYNPAVWTIRNYEAACRELAQPISAMQPWLRAQLEAINPEQDEASVASEKEAGKVPRSLGRAGFVYLVNEVNGPHYKIGRSKNPDDRTATFGVKLPYKVEYECVIQTSDMYALESELHAQFADKRADGEWFALTPADVDYIKSLAGGEL